MTRKGNFLALKIKKVKSVPEFWIISAHESELQFEIPENEWDDEYSEFYIDIEPWLENDFDPDKLTIGKHRAVQFLKMENENDGFRKLENYLDEYGDMILNLDIPAFNGILALKITKNDSEDLYKITIPDRDEFIENMNIEWDDGKVYGLNQNLKRLFKNVFSSSKE
ncbi:hypothetical protein MMJJ_04740 [Methanococcus maripaludis]|uniref:Uncharacterized protein n=1 Tax=Methanococcus maripaludis TaxID=39152 RepID=A0A2L1C930_METMI|nr:hypothetical protein MMJJ_04740 [Methanococcus maripaludis]